MNGAESLAQTLLACGVDVCFANPGTSEMHFVAALDRTPKIRAILALFEGVATGAADGYGRMAEKPACTLLHLGPGLANGLANLHNARRAASPVINIIGDHATFHLQYDAPLASDLSGLARPVSAWVHTTANARTVASDAARAVQVARTPPGQIATLILPADAAWNEADGAAPPLPLPKLAAVSDSTMARILQLLRNGKKSALLMRGPALRKSALEAAGRIRAATGTRLLCDTFVPRLQRGAGLISVERIPYFAEGMVEFLADIEQLIIVGSKPPVSFFAYSDKPSWGLAEGATYHYLAHAHEDGAGALEALAETLGESGAVDVPKLDQPPLPSGRLTASSVGQAIAHWLPEGAIISDEGATCSAPSIARTATSPPHDHLMLTGGSIGQGVPVGTGAAVACPGRKVICLQGDGGGMYTLQALWTQARERLDVTTVLFANHSYAILNIELARLGVKGAGPKALSMFDLSRPELDWVSLARGMGVEASRATTAKDFADQFGDAMKRSGPRLIEAVVEPATTLVGV